MENNIEEGIERIATFMMENPQRVDELIKYENGVYIVEIISPMGKKIKITLREIFAQIGKEFKDTIEYLNKIDKLIE